MQLARSKRDLGCELRAIVRELAPRLLVDMRQLQLKPHAQSWHAEHRADRVLDHAVGRDQARRIEDAEPVADRERQLGRNPHHRLDVRAVRVLRRSAGRIERRVLDDEAAAERHRPQAEVRAERALNVGLVRAERQGAAEADATTDAATDAIKLAPYPSPEAMSMTALPATNSSERA